MPIINFTNPIAVFTGLVIFVLVLYLAKETKKSLMLGIMLFIFLIILIVHTIEFVIIGQVNSSVYNAIVKSAGFDLVFIFLSFISYLWIDEIEAKENKKKSIDNSLDWFWNKV